MTIAGPKSSPGAEAGLGEKIEPTRSDLAGLAAPVSARVEIQNIVLFECRVKQDREADLSKENLRITVDVPEVGCVADRERKRITVTPAFILAAVRASTPDAAPLFTIEASFKLTYSIKAFDDLPDPNLEAFAQVNGVFNAWPYWRELVQSTSAKLGIRPIIVPVFRL